MSLLSPGQKAQAKKIALKYAATNFKSMVLKSTDAVAGTKTYTLTFAGTAGDISTDVTFGNGKDGKHITNMSFNASDKLVLTFNDATTLTTTLDKSSIKGDAAVSPVDNVSLENTSEQNMQIKGYKLANADTVIVKGATLKYVAIEKANNAYTTIASKEYVESVIQGALSLQDNWDASANAPNITSVTVPSSLSYFWIVTTAGTQVLDGKSMTFAEYDWIIKTTTGHYIKLAKSSSSASWGTLVGTIGNQTDLKNELDTRETNLLNKIYPIGHILMSENLNNPSTYLGIGNWVAYGQGRVPVGIDTTQVEFNTLGKTGGEKSHTMTESELVSHTHGYKYPQTTSVGSDGGIVGKEDAGGPVQLNWTTTAKGSSTPFNVMQPYIVCYMWKRTS